MHWNQFETTAEEHILADTISLKSGNNTIEAYHVRPAGNGPFPGIVLTHHLPGWDEFYRETAFRLARHGYAVICPNLYSSWGAGSPDDVAARARGDGGVSDASVLADCTAAAEFLKSQPNAKGKIGIIGSCSGGRHSYMVACNSNLFSGIVDLWGGFVVQPDLTPQRPKAPIDMTPDLSCPILGLFGNDDTAPSPEQVDQHEAALKAAGKDYEFHRYDGAGHGFFYYHRDAYRVEAAMDLWEKVFDFFGKNLN